MGRITRNEEIIRKQEALALSMQDRVKGKDTSIDVQMDVFDRVTKWIATKNKLEDDGAGGIADYKRRLHGESETDKHYPPSRRPRSGQPSGGPALDAIKSRVSGTDDGGDDGDSGDSGGEDAADLNGSGGVHAGADDRPVS